MNGPHPGRLKDRTRLALSPLLVPRHSLAVTQQFVNRCPYSLRIARPKAYTASSYATTTKRMAYRHHESCNLRSGLARHDYGGLPHEGRRAHRARYAQQGARRRPEPARRDRHRYREHERARHRAHTRPDAGALRRHLPHDQAARQRGHRPRPRTPARTRRRDLHAAERPSRDAHLVHRGPRAHDGLHRGMGRHHDRAWRLRAHERARRALLRPRRLSPGSRAPCSRGPAAPGDDVPR